MAVKDFLVKDCFHHGLLISRFLSTNAHVRNWNSFLHFAPLSIVRTANNYSSWKNLNNIFIWYKNKMQSEKTLFFGSHKCFHGEIFI